MLQKYILANLNYLSSPLFHFLSIFLKTCFIIRFQKFNDFQLKNRNIGHNSSFQISFIQKKGNISINNKIPIFIDKIIQVVSSIYVRTQLIRHFLQILSLLINLWGSLEIHPWSHKRIFYLNREERIKKDNEVCLRKSISFIQTKKKEKKCSSSKIQSS